MNKDEIAGHTPEGLHLIAAEFADMAMPLTAQAIDQAADALTALSARVETLEAALREAPAALNAMAFQVDAEWRGHDKAAAKHDLVVRGFREKVRHLLEGKAHGQ